MKTNDKPRVTTKPATDYRSWFSRILRWLKSHFGKRANRQVHILASSYSKDKRTALLTLSRELVGATKTWKLNHSASNGSLFVTLDNLSVQREYFRQERRKASKSRKAFPVSAEEKALYMEGYALYSHRVGFFWCYWNNGSVQLEPLSVIDADFSDSTPIRSRAFEQRAVELNDAKLKAAFQNTMAVKVCELVLAELRDMPPSGKDWDVRMLGINYCEMLQNYLESYLRSRGHQKPSAKLLKRDITGITHS